MKRHSLILSLFVLAAALAATQPAWAEDTPAAAATEAPAATETAPAAESSPAAPAPAPTPVYGWNQSIAAQVGLSQSSFDNWAKGGENSVAWQSSFVGNAAYDGASYNWNNTLKLAYGMIKSGESDTKKSSDEINLESVLTYKLGIHVDPYVSVRGITQFTTGYDYSGPVRVETSNFMDPGYFIESLGVGYTYMEIFKTRLGFAARETITRDFPNFSDDPATSEIEKIKVEPGLESVTNLDLKLNDILSFKSELALFSNAKAIDQVVVRWDNWLNMSVAKYLTASFNLQLLYDKTVSTRRQLSQALTLGLSYLYSNKP